jgi:hypothetical protein
MQCFDIACSAGVQLQRSGMQCMQWRFLNAGLMAPTGGGPSFDSLAADDVLKRSSVGSALITRLPGPFDRPDSGSTSSPDIRL